MKFRDLNENDIENYTHQTIYYTQCMLEDEKPTEPEIPDEPEKVGIVAFFEAIGMFFVAIFTFFINLFTGKL